MALDLNALKALAAQNAEVADDMNVAEAGGGGKKLPTGATLARLVQVVELGEHAQTYQGQSKGAAEEIFLGFELMSPGFCNDDGTPYLYRTRSIKISRNEKANARKIFLKMNWKNDVATFPELIDGLFLIYFKEVDSKAKPGTKVTVWDTDNILPPLDPLSKQPYQAPPGKQENYKLFVWKFANQECWDSLKIDGTYDDGKSKNWIQEKILSAVNFEGSPIQQVLGGIKGTIPTLAAPAAGVPAVPAAPAAAIPSIPTVPAIPSVPPAPQV